MEVAHYLLMKASRIELVLLPVSWVALAFVVYMQFSVGTPMDLPLEVSDVRSLEQAALPVEPLVPEELPPLVEAPSAVEEPQEPVQLVEERGDAMLFESEALLGTPFDQAITMPFD